MRTSLVAQCTQTMTLAAFSALREPRSVKAGDGEESEEWSHGGERTGDYADTAFGVRPDGNGCYAVDVVFWILVIEKILHADDGRY